MTARKTIALSATLLVLCACGKKDDGGDSASTSGTVLNSDTPKTTLAADATEAQTVSADPEGPLAGVSLEVPPGALAINVDLEIDEGDSLATARIADALGFAADGLTSAGPTTVLTADPVTETQVPMTLAIQTGPSAALTADEGTLVVIYKREKSDGTFAVGFYPADEFTRSGASLQLSTTTFGAFQPVLATGDIPSKSEEPTTVPIGLKKNPPLATFAVAAQTVSEATGFAELTVQLSRTADQVVTIPYEISGTASEDDHGAISGIFEVPAGETSIVMSFKITADGAAEGNETVIFTLADGKGARAGATKVHTVTLTD